MIPPMPTDPTSLRASLLPYLDALLRENAAVNLTAIRDRDQAIVLHVDDSLALAAAGLAARDCLDLGSGNGFPGVALRVLFPQSRVTLLERTRKKVLAIERALAQSGLPGIETLCIDAEQAPALRPELRRRFDLIVARAVGEPPQVARLAAPLLAPAGALVLWLDADTAPPALLVPRLHRHQIVRYTLSEPAPRTRQLAVYSPLPSPRRGPC